MCIYRPYTDFITFDVSFNQSIFLEVLKVTPYPTKVNFCRLLEQKFLYAGCRSCRATNSIKHCGIIHIWMMWTVQHSSTNTQESLHHDFGRPFVVTVGTAVVAMAEKTATISSRRCGSLWRRRRWADRLRRLATAHRCRLLQQIQIVAHCRPVSEQLLTSLV